MTSELTRPYWIAEDVPIFHCHSCDCIHEERQCFGWRVADNTDPIKHKPIWFLCRDGGRGSRYIADKAGRLRTWPTIEKARAYLNSGKIKD